MVSANGSLDPVKSTWAMLPASPPRLTVTSTQRIHVTATCNLGAGSTPGSDIDLVICYQPYSATDPNPNPVTAPTLGIWGLKSAANTRNAWTLSDVLTGLSGDLTFGMCARSADAVNWTNKDWCYTTVIVSN